MIFLAVEESNHGMYPEFYTGVVTSNPKYIKQTEITKKRGDNLFQRKKSLIGFEYWDIIFNENFGGIKNRDNFKTISIGEFAKFYNKKYNLNTIFMDGDIHPPQLEKIYEMIYGINKKIKFSYGKDLDKKIRIVNEADNLANLLYRCYRDFSLKELERRYGKKHLFPKVKDYEKFLI